MFTVATSAFGRCPYRILIGEECSLARRGLRGLLSSDPELKICGEVSNVRDLVQLAKKEKPDLIIKGTTSPQMDELEAIVSIHQTCPETRILIVLSMRAAKDSLRAALDSGAHAYIFRSDAESELLSAVHNLRRCGLFSGPTVPKLGINSSIRNLRMNGTIVQALTNRELEIASLLAGGYSNKEVAAKLNLSPRTVETHRDHIMHKMTFSNFSELVRFAIRERLIGP